MKRSQYDVCPDYWRRVQRDCTINNRLKTAFATQPSSHPEVSRLFLTPHLTILSCSSKLSAVRRSVLTFTSPHFFKSSKPPHGDEIVRPSDDRTDFIYNTLTNGFHSILRFPVLRWTWYGNAATAIPVSRQIDAPSHLLQSFF